MARIRTVKPEFWTSEQVTDCSPIARLLFIGMWNFCDDGGNHPASVKTLKMLIFPSDDITIPQIQSMIDELVTTGLLVQYTDNNKNFWHVTGWGHQKIEKPTYKFPRYNGTKTESAQTDSQPIDDKSPNDIQPIDHGKEGIGKGEDINKKNNASASASFEKPEQPEPGYASIDTKAPHQPFVAFKMFVGWKPEPKSWGDNLKAAFHKVKPEQFTDYTLADFIFNNKDGQEKTEQKWQQYYINAVAKRMFDQPKPAAPEQPAPKEYKDPAHKYFIPLTEEQKRKTPPEALAKLKGVLAEMEAKTK